MLWNFNDSNRGNEQIMLQTANTLNFFKPVFRKARRRNLHKIVSSEQHSKNSLLSPSSSLEYRSIENVAVTSHFFYYLGIVVMQLLILACHRQWSQSNDFWLGQIWWQSDSFSSHLGQFSLQIIITYVSELKNHENLKIFLLGMLRLRLQAASKEAVGGEKSVH